ncbi:MAG: molybdopterin-dependent oxidoreductase [Halodesulfurarchaeum sp.]
MSNRLSLSRRDLLKAGGIAALGLGVGTSGCVSAIDEPMDVERASIATQCWVGKQDCSLLAATAGGRLIKLNGHPDDPRTEGGVCPKGQAQIAQVYDPTRVKRPLKRTNEKGKHGTWTEISWEQALSEIGADLREKLADDPRRVIFQTGREKAPVWHAEGFVDAMNAFAESETGAPGVRYYTNEAVSSGAVERMNELTFATSGGMESDFEHCEYLIAWGTGLSVSGGAHMCQITWPRQIVKAKEENDLTVVVLDPQRRPSGGEMVDEWLPIEPGTDLAFFNALNHVLVRDGYVDERYLQLATNAPCLVDPETGHILRSEDAEDPAEAWQWADGELVYDKDEGAIVAHETASDPALEGTYDVDGTTAKPAFQLYREHLEQYTPEWAAEITGIDAETIERIATEWGETASIGEMTTVGGAEIPRRPVATHGFHAGQNSEMGLATTQAQQHTSMLVGAIDVVGSTRPRRGKIGEPVDRRAEWRQYAFHPETIADTPDGPALNGTKYHPIYSDGYSLVPSVLSNPEQYDLPVDPNDMAMVVQMANPVMSAPRTEQVIAGLSNLGTVVVVDPFVSETADMVADYVLPAATLDKLEGPGPHSGWTGDAELSSIRAPVMDPMWESKPDPEIYIELARALGIESQYVEAINRGLGLGRTTEFTAAEFARMDADTFLRSALNRWAKTKGRDLEYFLDRGQIDVEVYDGDDPRRYGWLWERPRRYSPYGVKHAFYSETLARLGDAVRERGVRPEEYPFVKDYNAFPTWREPTMTGSPGEYPLTLLTYKQVEHQHSRTANNRLLNEIRPDAPIKLNPETAKELGIDQDEHVTVETHDAVTGETHTVEGRAAVLRGLRPGTVAVAHHHGNWNEVAAVLDEGPNVNALIPSGPGYRALDGGQSFHVKARVRPAEGGEH